MATITVLRDINTAPTADVRTMPIGANRATYRKMVRNLAVPDPNVVFPYDEAHAKVGLLGT